MVLSKELEKLYLKEKTYEEFGYDIYSFSHGSIKKIFHKCIKCDKPKLNSIREFYNNKGLSHFKCTTNALDIIKKEYHYLLLQKETINKYEENHIYLTSDYVFIECEICKKPKLVKIFHLNRGVALVHKNCSQKKIEQTNLKKYNVKYGLSSKIIQKKIEQTNLKKYGFKNASSSEIIRNRVKKTNLDRYGVENLLSNKEIKDKIKKTNLDKYGVENPIQNINIYNKVKQTNLKKYGVDCLLKLKEIHDIRIKQIRESDYIYKNDNILKEIWLEQIFYDGSIINPNQKLLDKWSKGSHEKIEIICSCGKKFTPVFKDFMYGKHISCGHNNGTSYSEKEVFNFIKQFCNDAINRYKENDIEFDIYIPSKKICIEYNGLIWHGEKFSKDYKKDYKKYLYCKNNNIRYIGIFEDEWIFEKERIKNYLLNLLDNNLNKIKIRPQKLNIIYQDKYNKEIKDFIDKYHYLSEKTSLTHIWSCYYNNKLIAVFGIGKPTRQNIKEKFELKRVCIHPNYKCYGLWSYLIKNYVKKILGNCIITSFSDNRRDSGSLYEKLGFIKIKETLPDYYWCDATNHRFHKSKLRKTKQEKEMGETEKELRYKQGLYRIWDCGKTKWNLYI